MSFWELDKKNASQEALMIKVIVVIVGILLLSLLIIISIVG